MEICDEVDDDCNGRADDAYATKVKSQVWDWDGDDVGDVDVKVVKACKQPTDAPAYCASLQGNVPATCRSAPLEPTQYESWDWDCSGAPNACDGAQALAVVTSVYPPDGATVGTCFATVDTSSQAALDNICGQNDAASCTDMRLMTTAQCGASDCVSSNGTIFKTCRNFCGKQYTQVFCGASAGVCRSAARSVGPITRRFSTKTFGCR